MKNDEAKYEVENMQTEKAQNLMHMNCRHKPLFGGKNRATIRVEAVQLRLGAATERLERVNPPTSRSQPETINADDASLSGKRKADQMEWTTFTASSMLCEIGTTPKRRKGEDLHSNDRADGKFTANSSTQSLIQQWANSSNNSNLFTTKATSGCQSIQHEGSPPSPHSSRLPLRTILMRRQPQGTPFDENEIDLILLATSATDHSKSINGNRTRMTEPHIDPAIAYQQKQTEIKARGGRKGQYGVVISAKIFKDRESKGWHKHQNVPLQEQREKKDTLTTQISFPPLSWNG